jgi:hypothetical protein
MGSCYSASWAALDSSGLSFSVAVPRTPPPMLLCSGGAQRSEAVCAAPSPPLPRIPPPLPPSPHLLPPSEKPSLSSYLVSPASPHPHSTPIRHPSQSPSAAVGHDRGSRYPGNGREAHAAWLRSASMEDRRSQVSGERLTLHGCGRPQWRIAAG